MKNEPEIIKQLRQEEEAGLLGSNESKEVKKYLSRDEIERIFNSDKMLKNIDYIFSRSVELN